MSPTTNGHPAVGPPARSSLVQCADNRRPVRLIFTAATATLAGVRGLATNSNGICALSAAEEDGWGEERIAERAEPDGSDERDIARRWCDTYGAGRGRAA